MEVVTAIRTRRTVKKYLERPIPREVLEELLELTVWAPNHRMTEPWRFLVLGPEARRSYGEALGRIRAGKLAQPQAAAAVRKRTLENALATPATLAFVQRVVDDPEIREEDYAAIYMGIQNLLLGATARGLGAQVKTGPVLVDPAFRDAIGVDGGERIVALVHLGRSEAVPSPKSRAPAREHTRWLP
jgi:nitroreductase